MRLSGNIDKRTIQGQFLTISKFPDGIGVECYIQNVTLASSEKKRKIYLDQKEEKETNIFGPQHRWANSQGNFWPRGTKRS